MIIVLLIKSCMKKYLFIISMILFVGCSPDKKDYIECGEIRFIDSFPKELELAEIEPLPIDLTGCVDILQADSLLICKMENSDYFWKILSLNSLQLLGSYARVGHGHEEFEVMPSSEFIHMVNDSIFCDIFDSNSQTLYRCNLTESVNRNELIFCNKKKLGSVNNICNIIALSDSTYYTVKYHNNCGFMRSILAANGAEKIIECGNLNKVTAEEINVLSASRTINIEKKKAVEAMLRFSQINLYSLDKEANLTLSMEPNLKSLSSTESLLKIQRKKYFGSIFSADKWFGTLYYNMSLKNFFTGVGENSYILFFDWDGNPLLRIKIPYIAISFFIYNDYLYIFSNAMEDEKMYKYSLIELNKKLGSDYFADLK